MTRYGFLFADQGRALVRQEKEFWGGAEALGQFPTFFSYHPKSV